MALSRLRLATVTAAALIAALSATAHAQSTVEAEKLFRDGKQLMKQGNVASACEAFDGSQRIESNIATLLSLADCREKNGQLASAWGWFLKAESLTRDDSGKKSLNATARRRAAAIEPRLSYLTINVPEESHIDGLVVSRNGVVVDRGTYNRAVPVDGGDYKIEGKAPGHEPWSTSVTVGPESDRQAVEVPKFKEAPKLIGTAPAASTEPDAEPLPAAPQPVLTPIRYGALGAAGLAVVALGGGVFLGLSAQDLDDEAVGLCKQGACSPAQADAANEKRDQAQSRALSANVAFGVSAAAAIGAGVLWFIGGPSSDSGESAEPEGTALRLRPHVGDFTGVTLGARF
jgi:hypothetical protein